jgi:hypothetical protein
VGILHKSISDKPFRAPEASLGAGIGIVSIDELGAGDKLFVHLPAGLRKGNSKQNEGLAGKRCGLGLRLGAGLRMELESKKIR